MASNNIPEYLATGELARFIPVVSDSSKEARILGSTLATLSSVREFAEDLLISIGKLGSVGKKVGKYSTIKCYTEVVFNSKNKTTSEDRPDGLIVITSGKSHWRALVEAKISNKPGLKQEQIERYLDIAKEHGIDAVITISNQFAITPKHYPYAINKSKLKKVNLYHWSWAYIATKAEMLANNGNISDPTQSYLLSEMVRFYNHKSTGIASYNKMDDSWKEVCEAVKRNTPLKKDSKEIVGCVGSWHQFVRNNAISLGLEIGVNVGIILPKAYRDDPDKHIADDAAKLAANEMLVAEFNIPDAAGKIILTTHLARQQITASMQLQAPDGRATSKGKINWLLGQLKKADAKTDTQASSATSAKQGKYASIENDILVRAIWPGKIETTAYLEQLQQYGPEQIIGNNTNIAPVAFKMEFTKKIDWKEFTGQYKFVEVAGTVLLEFYSKAGQYIKAWVPPPPKVRSDSKKEATEEDNKSTTPAPTESTSADKAHNPTSNPKPDEN